MQTILRKTVLLSIIILLLIPACTPPSPITTVACNVVDLVKAIDSANADATLDILELDAGCTYTLTAVNTTVTGVFEESTFDYGDVGLPPITTPIVINGHNATIGRGAKAPAFRIFHILKPGDLTLNDLTLTNGLADRPGSGFPSSGGAIYNKGLLTVNRSTLHSNRATYYGGAVFDEYPATTHINDSTIRANTAPSGGGIFEYQSTLLSVAGSSITYNDGTTEGGGINVGFGTEVVISKSTISFNHSGRRGGGLYKDIGSERRPTTIDNSTFEGNTAEWGGGGVFIVSSPLMVLSSQFLQNQAGEYGGGLGYQNDKDETVTIRSSTFDGNTAGMDGGAIHFSGKLMAITNTTLRNNTAENGGAIHNAEAVPDHYIHRTDTTLQIERSAIEHNTAKAAGGGIFNGGMLTVKLTSFTGNRSTSPGGGIQNLGTAFVQDSTLKDNKSGQDGGGMHTRGAATVISSTFANNDAARGGGLSSVGGNTALINDTFSSNSASTGGGIFNWVSGVSDLKEGKLFASFITVVGNRASTGGGIATSGGSLKIKNSIVALNISGGDCSTGAGGFSAVAENLDSDGTCPGFTLKADPRLDALADNGGSTQTHALWADSPALDAAPDCTTVIGIAVPIDQRSQPRPAGSFCDLGAYERVKEKISPLPSAQTPTLVDITLTPTFVQPSLTAIKNANCRYGPGTVYEVADTLFAGKSAPIVGRNEQNTWWQIKGPTFGSLCWVSKATVEVSGSTEGVPIGVAPPTPTFTPEPRPKPQGCYVYDASGQRVCTVPCPANARPGGACKP